MSKILRSYTVYNEFGEQKTKKVEITINAFKVVKTFDITQTEGKEIPSIRPAELSGSIEG